MDELFCHFRMSTVYDACNTPERRRTRNIKLGIVVAIRFAQISIATRMIYIFIFLYQYLHEYKPFALLCLVNLVFLVLHLRFSLRLLILRRRVMKDSIWFSEAFENYAEDFWARLFPTVVWYIVTWPLAWLNLKYFTIVDVVLCFLISVFILMIWFRQSISCLRNKHLTVEKQAVFTVTKSKNTFANIVVERKKSKLFWILTYCVFVFITLAVNVVFVMLLVSILLFFGLTST